MSYGYGDSYDIGVDYLLGQQAQITQEIADAQATGLGAVAGGAQTKLVGFDAGGNPVPVMLAGDSNGAGFSSNGTTATVTLPQNLQTTGNVTFASLALAASGTAITNWIGASATLDFPNTAAQTSSDLTITATGAADGDAVILGVPNAAVNANACYTAWVSASNTVTVRLNNFSAGAIDPASGTFKVLVIQW
jgi:hypothetical protein